MRLNFIPAMTPEDRERMRLKVGDIVLFEGRKYTIDSVGAKYAWITSLDEEQRKGMAKLILLSRWIPEDEANEADSVNWLEKDDE